MTGRYMERVKKTRIVDILDVLLDRPVDTNSNGIDQDFPIAILDHGNIKDDYPYRSDVAWRNNGVGIEKLGLDW